MIIQESDLKDNRMVERHPDTTLYNLDKFTVIDTHGRKYQNLGNNGTAMRSIFYPTPTQIGRTSGLNAYNIYMNTPDKMKYYDTKSPFINLELVLGGKGRSVVDMAFSRNVKENWNVGFDIYRITSDKQIGKNGPQDRNVVGTVADIYSYYKHPEKPYSAMINISTMNWNVEETGGIYIQNLATATRADLYQFQDSPVQLSKAQTQEKRLGVHLFHQYNWTKPLQFYHQFDIKNQNVGYKDYTDGTSTTGTYNTFTGFYPRFLLGTDSTYEHYQWKEVVNEIGIKGDLANIFYRLYLKRRDMNFDYLYFNPTSHFSENFVGGYTRFDWKEKFNVEAQAEIMQTGQYKLIGSLNSDFLFGSYKSFRYKPSFISEQYFGNNYEWHNSFKSGFTNEIQGGIKVKVKNLTVKPQIRLLTMNQFMYFDTLQNPQQSGSIAFMASVGGNFDLKFTTNKTYNESFHFENEIFFTQKSGAGSDLIRVPQLFYNGKIYWNVNIFKKAMPSQIGVDIHAQSSYYGLSYAPGIQQFYLQDKFNIQGYYTIDPYFSMKVENVRVFIKYVYANQQANSGYFVTPYYPGIKRMIDFGVRWLFFD